MPAAVAVPLITAGVAGGASIYGAHRASRSSDRAAQYQTQQANYAADLEAKAQAEALAFLKEQEAARRREWQMTQDRNYQLYQEREERLSPYRRFGAGAIAQMGQPIPRAGSLGARMGG